MALNNSTAISQITQQQQLHRADAAYQEQKIDRLIRHDVCELVNNFSVPKTNKYICSVQALAELTSGKGCLAIKTHQCVSGGGQCRVMTSSPPSNPQPKTLQNPPPCSTSSGWGDSLRLSAPKRDGVLE